VSGNSSESKSAARLVFLIAVFVFLGETLIMFFLPLLPLNSPFLPALIDATMLIIILSPALYFGLFRSLVQIIEKRRQAETELRKHHDHLEEIVKERTIEISALLEGSRALLKHRDFETSARLIFEKCKETIGAQAGYIALLDKTGTENEIWYLNSGGLTCSVDPSLSMPIRGFRKEAFEKGKAVYENHFFDSQWQQLMPPGHVLCENVLFAPLIIDEKPIGLLGLANKPSGFNDNDLRIATAFSELASISLLNSRTLESLTTSEERLRSVVETAMDAIVAVDSQGHVIFWNQRAEKMFGYLPDEIIGKSVYQIIPHQYRDAHSASFKKVIATGQSNLAGKILRFTGLKKDDCEFPLELTIASWKTRDGLFFTAIIRDISRQIQTENGLKWELDVNAALSALYEPLITPSSCIGEIAAIVLEKAKQVTKSEHGYVSSINPVTGNADVHNFSAMMEEGCRITPEKTIVFTKNEDGHYGGLWGYALNTLEPFYTNEPQNHPASESLPEGHIPIKRFLGVPVKLGQILVGQIALANKPGDYTDLDLEAIARVANFYALAIQKHMADEALQKAKKELEDRVEERTRKLLLTNLNLENEIEERKLAEKELQKNKSMLQATFDGMLQANLNLENEIEERKLVEAELKKNKGMLQATFDGISEPLILVDKHMGVKIMNKSAAEYYGITDVNYVYGKLCYEDTAKTGPCNICQIPSAVSEGKEITFERKNPDNPERLEQIVIYPIKDDNDETGDAIIRITDITEAKQFERMLIQSEKMASLGVLVSSVAHEINNPNNFVTFNIPILREYVQEMLPVMDTYAEKNPELELCHMPYPQFRTDIFKLMDNVEHGSKRISSFVFNLREFAQSGGIKPFSWVDLAILADKVLSICQNKIRKTVKSLIKDVPEGLPKIYSDPYTLEQVLINLLLNAAQAADKPDPWVKLTIMVNDEWKDHAIIQVSDNGCGIDQKNRLKIFDPFFTTKPSQEGTGLGLYVCHNLVEGLGGRIEVESKPGEGSSFTVILPDKERRQKPRI
jgi:PAS domain S-box-containing protein